MLLQFSWKRAKFVEFALRLENVDQARWTCKPLIVFTLLHNCFLSVVYHHIWSETFGCMDDDYQTGHKSNYQGLPLKTLAANMVCWMILSLFINTLLCANQNNKTWVNKIETVFWDKIEKTRVITPSCLLPLQWALASSKTTGEFPGRFATPSAFVMFDTGHVVVVVVLTKIYGQGQGRNAEHF